MRSELISRLLESTPKRIEYYVDWQMDLILYINKIIDNTNKDVNKLPKTQQFLNKDYDFSLRYLSELSEELETDILKNLYK